MKIHFDKDLIAKAFKITHEAVDLIDVAHDIDAINGILSKPSTIENLVSAVALDKILRERYPTIEKMLEVADCFSISPVPVSSNNSQDPPYPNEYKNLEQDYFGILCDVLMKKGVTSSIEQCIKRVD